MTIAAIRTENLTKLYGHGRRRSVGIVDVDLEVFEGEVFGFLGPNGAGKTTTIRLLLDFLRPTSGRANVLGLDSNSDSVKIHRRVGYLAAGPTFFDRLTGRELLQWLASMRGGVSRSVIDAWADRLELDLSRPIRDLSRGNRQKVGIVQAFMHSPALLLLDEPTSGLDPLVQHTFHEIVNEAVREGRTVFLSSHVLDEVGHLCNRVGIIREGRLAAVEDVVQLRARAVREVTLRFSDDVDPAALRTLVGVSDVKMANGVISLRASGNLDELVKLAARHRVVDFLSTPVDLDEVFLTYYRDEERAA